MSIEKTFKKMTEIEHVLKKTGMYLGAVKDITTDAWIYNSSDKRMSKQVVTYNPALIKLFDEVLTNSVDEAKRNKKITTIHVTVDKTSGLISIKDNGGIPVEIHKEYNKYVPELIFGEFRTSSNYNDDETRVLVGTNGLGAKLTNCFSTKFKVETADGKHAFTQEYSNNMHERTTPEIVRSTKKFTQISFVPDYARLHTSLHDGNMLKIQKRIYDAAGLNPKLTLYFNNELIKFESHRQYVNLFLDREEVENLTVYEPIIEIENNGWYVAVAAGSDEFKHVSFVNGTETPDDASTHVQYTAGIVADHLKELAGKKAKREVRAPYIKQFLKLFVFATIDKPSYTSQTKERLATEPKEFGFTIDIDGKTLKRIEKELPILDRVADYLAVKDSADLAEKLRKDVKKTKIQTIKKLYDCHETKHREKTSLFIAEGDSAAKPIYSVCDKRYQGVFALRGKPLNVRELSAKKLVENEEFKNLITAIGLSTSGKVSKEQLRYGKIVVASDADCIDASSMVVMHDDTTKKISEVNIGDIVKSHSGINKVVDVIQTNKQVVTIGINHSDSITASENHKHIIIRNGTVMIVTTNELCVGDKLVKVQ